VCESVCERESHEEREEEVDAPDVGHRLARADQVLYPLPAIEQFGTQ